MRELRVMPITLRQAREFVQEHHRHHNMSQGGLWALALMRGDELVGVAIAGRPVSRKGYCEIVRVCVLEGVPNGCSMLYGRCRRVAQAMGSADGDDEDAYACDTPARCAWSGCQAVVNDCRASADLGSAGDDEDAYAELRHTRVRAALASPPGLAGKGTPRQLAGLKWHCAERGGWDIP